MNNLNVGQWGEDLAVRHLDGKGYKILERNFRYKHGEVDIIAFDDPMTVFVEVRTRQSDALVSGYFSVSKKKKQALKPACMYYINTNDVKFYRFDVVEIDYNTSDFELFHFENVPFFPIKFTKWPIYF